MLTAVAPGWGRRHSRTGAAPTGPPRDWHFGLGLVLLRLDLLGMTTAFVMSFCLRLTEDGEAHLI